MKNDEIVVNKINRDMLELAIVMEGWLAANGYENVKVLDSNVNIYMNDLDEVEFRLKKE